MSFPSPVTSSAIYATTSTGASAQMTATLASGSLYVLTVTTDTYVAQGANPTASAADGSTLLAGGESMLIDGALGAKIALRADASSGKATITKAKMVR